MGNEFMVLVYLPQPDGRIDFQVKWAGDSLWGALYNLLKWKEKYTDRCVKLEWR